MDFGDAIRDRNDLMVRYQEGRALTDVPEIMKRIVDEITGFNNENLVNPMLELSKSILKQGLIFEMPETLVDDGVLSNVYRKELEAGLPTFTAFMQMTGKEADTKGIVQGFLRHRESGKVWAVRVKGNVFVDVASGAIHPMKKGVKFEIISPYGESMEVDANALKWDNPEYELVAVRNPSNGKWEGDRAAAEQAWDTEISDSPRPDVLREYFEEMGFELPDGVRFTFSKKANIEQWSARKDGVELYRIRRIVPFKHKDAVVEAHEAYNTFKNKLLVYKGGTWRDPTFVMDGKVPQKIWEPTDNYFPHMIDWRNMSVDPGDGWRYKRFLEYAAQMADIPENGFLDAKEAADVLATHHAQVATKSYGHLEQARTFFFPNYRRDFFNVWQSYFSRAFERMEVIREMGQQGDMLNAMLAEFVSEEGMEGRLKPRERAVLKIRKAKGYYDFVDTEKGSNEASPFVDLNDNPIGIDPFDSKFSNMAPADWQALIDAEVVTLQDDGTYIPTIGGILGFENTAFLKGQLYDGMRNALVAQDVVMRQLGWEQGQVLDEELGEIISHARSFTGAAFLPRSWATNAMQIANPMAQFGLFRTIGAALSLIRKADRNWADETGALAIDVMNEFGALISLPQRLIAQTLGSVPAFQSGKFHPIKSLIPKRSWIEDISIRTVPWTPFFAVERFNRRVSAIAAKRYAAATLKKMVKHPNRIKVETAELTEVAHAYELKPKLQAVLNIPNLTAADIKAVSGMTHEEVRAEMPHLWPVHDLLVNFAKHGSDNMQHRIESIDRARIIDRSPIVSIMALFLNFDIAQTKMQSDNIKREWRIMHALLNERNPVKFLNNEATAKTLGSIRYLRRVMMYFSAMGLGGLYLQNFIRFRTPRDEDMNFLMYLSKAGSFGIFGRILEQELGFGRKGWGRRDWAEDMFMGPSLGFIANVIQTRGKAALGYIRVPPIGPVGPSMAQVLRQIEGDDKGSGLGRPASSGSDRGGAPGSDR